VTKTLKLKYKGFELELEFERNWYTTNLEVERGKTIYQILFELLIDGRMVNQKYLAKVLQSQNIQLSSTTIIKSMRIIEKALQNSRNSKLSSMRFRRKPHGGLQRVLDKKNPRGAYSVSQYRIIREAIYRMLTERQLEKKPYSIEELRDRCLSSLRQKGQEAGVNLGKPTLLKKLGEVIENHPNLPKPIGIRKSPGRPRRK